MLEKLSSIDFFPKASEKTRVRTLSGGALSLITLFLFLILFVIEFSMFLNTTIDKELYVDEGIDSRLNINLDITFPSLPCSYMSLDAVDSTGQSALDIQTDLFQQRLNKRGDPISAAEIAKMEAEIYDQIEHVPIPQNSNNCGSCYGAETDIYQCCETCEDVRNAYRDKGWAFTSAKGVAQCTNEGYSPRMIAQKNEGCQLYGSVTVGKVSGNFHVAPGRSIKNTHGHSHDTAALTFSDRFNTTHIINELSFGEEFNGRIDPLDGYIGKTDDKLSLFQYFIKIVPTSYVKRNGETIETNQYSVTQHYQAMSMTHDSEKLPGIFFMYDLSPIKVVLKETSQGWTQFLTAIFGTAGGLFTISMLLDWFFFRGARSLSRSLRKSS